MIIPRYLISSNHLKLKKESNKMKNNLFKLARPFLTKHEPEILMSIGIGGLIFSTVWAIKATEKAVRKLDLKKEKLKKEKLTFKETFVETWKLYLPVVVSVGISVPCIIAGNRVSSRRNAALITAYTLTETAFQTYQDKTKEVVGEKKEKEIHENTSKDLIKNGKYDNKNVIITGDGESLFYEPLSGRYFKTSWNKISRAANELNATAIGGIFGVISLTDWFNKLGLDETAISDTIGWSIENGKAGLLDISIDSHLTPDNLPCGAIHYINRPKPIN